MDYTLVEHEMRALDNDLYAEMNGLNYVADGLLSVVDDVHVTTYADIIVDEYQRNCLRLLPWKYRQVWKQRYTRGTAATDGNNQAGKCRHGCKQCQHPTDQ